MRDILEGLVDFAPSSDPEGDCGIVLTLQFKTEEEANKDIKPDYSIESYRKTLDI